MEKSTTVLNRLAPLASNDETKSTVGVDGEFAATTRRRQQQQKQQNQCQTPSSDKKSFQLPNEAGRILRDIVAYETSNGCSPDEREREEEEDLMLLNPSQMGLSERSITCSTVVDAIKSSVASEAVQDGKSQKLVQSYNIPQNERLSPCYSHTYATLTPLQPLPPISTVSERFGGLVGSTENDGSGIFMQNNGTAITSYDTGAYACKYSKEGWLDVDAIRDGYEPMPTEPGSPVAAANSNTNNYSQQHNNQSSYHLYNQSSIASQVKPDLSTITMNNMLPYDTYASNLISASHTSQMKNLQPSTAGPPMLQQVLNLNGLQVLHSASSAHNLQAIPQQQVYQVTSQLLQQPAPQQLSPPTQQCLIRMSPTQDQPSSSTDMHDDSRQELEEINTREIAVKVSNELKKYSIPQAVFAQRILGRSQGTLSDLLRNPKPWSKLKSGRETFRRMWKWLKEPEKMRMSQLRLIGGLQPAASPESLSPPIKQSLVCKRSREFPSARPDSQQPSSGKKPRMVFTEIQRRTLVAIFKEIKRPSKEIQATIAEQLGLKVSTVVNFFMNARRRSVDKYMDDVTDKDMVNNAVSSTASSLDDEMTTRQ